MKIVDYVVVGASSEARNLEHVVESAIKDGRQPLGGVSVSSLEEIDGFIKTYYSQAMVKYEEEIVVIDNDEVKKDQIIAGLLECRKTLISALISVGTSWKTDECKSAIRVIDDKIKEYTKR